MRRICAVLLLCLAILPWSVISNTHDNVKDLITDLFTTNSYNTMVRPSADQDVTYLYVNLYLVGITDIDEVKEKMSSTAFLELYWIDDYLKWDPANYNDTDTIYVPQKNIWKPDIALENGFTKLKELGDDFLLTTVTFDGEVGWRPYEVFETKCSISIEYFPFDKQTCDIKFGVWTSPLSAVDVELGSKGILLDEYQTNGEWDILSTNAIATESAYEGAIVTFSITVKRRPQYILFNVVLPIIMLSILATFVFVLPIESGEKMGYIMTLYLAFAVFLTIVSASLPVSSSMSLLSLYLILLLSLGTAIVMITTLELRLNFRDGEVPKVAKNIVRLSKALRCQRSNMKIQDLSEIPTGNGHIGKSRLEDPVTPTHVKPFVEPEVTEEEFTWPDVTSAIDFFCFWFFLVSNIVITVSVFVDGYIKSNA